MSETPYQDAVREYGSQRKAADALGVPRRTLRGWLAKEEQADALNKLGLEEKDAQHAVLDELSIKGTSRYYSLEDGGIWVKTDRKKQEEVQAFEAIFDRLSKEIIPVEPKEYKHIASSNLCSTYIISDFHLGQYSCFEETGQEWDLEKAYKVLCGWIDRAIAAAPFSKQAVLCDLGDFLHADGLVPATPASGHILDASGRFRSVVDVAIDVFDYCIQALLEKHENVHVIIAEGNHNQDSSYWQTVAVSRRYPDNPRITFDYSKIPYYAYQWGQTSLFFHHGHKRRINNVSEALIANFRKIHGNTLYSYAHVGHLHHRELKEYDTMIVEQHSTLAAKDAHSARGGYHSERGASVINYHSKYGEVGRSTIRPEMLI